MSNRRFGPDKHLGSRSTDSVQSRLDEAAKQLAIAYSMADGEKQDLIARARTATARAEGFELPEGERQ